MKKVASNRSIFRSPVSTFAKRTSTAFGGWGKRLPCRRRSDDSTWPCHPGLSWAARLAAPAATPCQPSRGYVDDRFHRPSIRTAWRLRAVGRRLRPAAAGPFPWAPCPRVRRPPAMATEPGCDCWAHRRGSTSSCHLSASATKLWSSIIHPLLPPACDLYLYKEDSNGLLHYQLLENQSR